MKNKRFYNFKNFLYYHKYLLAFSVLLVILVFHFASSIHYPKNYLNTAFINVSSTSLKAPLNKAFSSLPEQQLPVYYYSDLHLSTSDSLEDDPGQLKLMALLNDQGLDLIFCDETALLQMASRNYLTDLSSYSQDFPAQKLIAARDLFSLETQSEKKKNSFCCSGRFTSYFRSLFFSGYHFFQSHICGYS